MAKDPQACFWQVMNGALPPPRMAQTLGIEFTAIDADAGTIETTFQPRTEFTNPAGHVQGCMLAVHRVGVAR